MARSWRRADAVDCEVNTGFDDVSVIERRAVDGSRYLFVRTNQHDQARAGTANLKEKMPGGAEMSFPYQLEALGAKVLYLAPGVTDPSKGEWLPKTEAAVPRPTDLPAAVKVTDIQATAEAAPTAWHPVPAKSSLNDLGIYDSRFVFYHATLKVSQQDLQSSTGLNLGVDHPVTDAIVAEVNGRRLAAAKGSGDGTFAAQPALHPGDNDVLLLYENTGTANGGIAMEKRAGVTGLRLEPAMKNGAVLAGWRMQLVTNVDQPGQLPEIAPDVQDSKWTAVKADSLDATQLKPKQDAVFRTTVDVSDQDIQTGRTAFTVSHIHETGVIFVNGQQIGETENWNQSYTFDAAKQLHAGKNSLAIFVQNPSGTGGIGPVTLSSAGAAKVGSVTDLSYADVSPSIAAEASKPGSLKGLSASAGTAPILYTERLTFELPESKPDVWVPWLLRLHATGNGFLFVNGHASGGTGRKESSQIFICRSAG